MLCNNSTKLLLNLPEDFTLHVQMTAAKPIYKITMKRKTHMCPSCGTATDKVHDYREQEVQDIPLQQSQFFLVFRKRRYVCPHCGKRFYEENSFLSKYQRRTNRCQEHILGSLSQLRPLSSIADEYFTSSGVVRRIMRMINYPKPSVLPEVLAIDEFRGNVGEKFQCLLVDPQHQTFLDVLPSRNSEALHAYFNAYSKEVRAKVKYIVMDLSSLFYSVMHSCFPKAKIIADKFHVVRLINWALEKVRKEEQKQFHSHRRKYFKRSRTLLLKHRNKLSPEEKEQLALMLEVSPRIRDAYGLKELFYDMMESKTLQEIRERYKLFLQKAEQADLKAFNKHIPTINKWFDAIVRGILTGYSNGFIEGCNNRTKVFKRISYGLSDFTLFRNRLLYISNNTPKKIRDRLLA